ncbi:unnamed protein product [Adineta steineri]|uniref:Nuclear receptor domain-containing protein n=1 Tax=Adineta steineri TaxID=433720 RepID=A0A815BI25_9BILA|nr:unnamed protein product [Adineta steineri]
MVLTKRTSNIPLICQICGDRARGINFEVITCMSCKAFFRRHALQPANHVHCQLDDNCDITQFTRSGCSACRLKKCFSLGMNPKLIRHSLQINRQCVKKKPSLLPTPLPLNLLQNDASTLSNSEWNLLSNIIHAYDQGNAIEHTTFMLQQQSILPPKLRIKSITTMDIIGFFYTTVQSFIERTSYFQDLSIDVRQTLLQRNTEIAGAYNSLFIVRESNALTYPAYLFGSSNLYGHANVPILKKFISLLENNGVLFKMMLLVIGFSNSCSIVNPDDMKYMTTVTNINSLVHIENILVTMLWKYLNYQYGFSGAVKCFSSYVIFILNIIRWIEIGRNRQHEDLVDVCVENIDQSLVVIN